MHNSVKYNARSGQAALIVVLMSVVVLTVGLSTVARLTTDVRISSQGEDGARAIALADAGVEKALLIMNQSPLPAETNPPTVPLYTWPSPYGPAQPHAEFTFDYIGAGVDDTGAPETSYVIEQIKRGDVATVWLTSNPNDCSSTRYAGDVEIDWDPAGGDVEFMIYYDKGGIRVDRQKLPPSTKKFENATFDPEGDLTPDPDTWCFIRMKPLSNSNTITFTVHGFNPTFPAQGIRTLSRGITPQGAVRAIEVSRFHPQLPSIFDYALYSGSNLQK